jgi:hypothetical protein
MPCTCSLPYVKSRQIVHLIFRIFYNCRHGLSLQRLLVDRLDDIIQRWTAENTMRKVNLSNNDVGSALVKLTNTAAQAIMQDACTQTGSTNKIRSDANLKLVNCRYYPKCTGTFSNPSNMKRHCKSVCEYGSKDKEHKCTDCKVEFSCTTDLRIHRNTLKCKINRGIVKV